VLRRSAPGERRGGRKRGTPNRRTILRDRILSIGLDDSAASQHAFLLKLLKDRKLPADIRIAVAPNCFPAKRTSRAGRPRALAGSRTRMAQEALGIEGSAVVLNGAQKPAVVPAIRDWTPQALDALFDVVQDATADPKERRKAALRIAQFLLPKAGTKAKIIPDEYGFLINPNLVSAYREMQRELGTLTNGPTRKIPANAEKIKKLEARSEAIRQRCQVPCPSIYGEKQAARDRGRLIEFASLHDKGTVLTQAQKTEEAHLRARMVVLDAGPEAMARRRCAALEEAEWRLKQRRLSGELPAPRLSRKERTELKFLRLLYPAGPKLSLSELDDDGFEMDRYHPFVDELPAPDGNFYPLHSKLRPGPPREDAEKAHLAPDEARIYELEERRAVGSQLTASEEKELRDLRGRHREYAARIDLMDLLYLNQWRREFEIARKAGLDIDAINEQAEVCCLRLRDDSKFINDWQARRFLRYHRGKAAGAAGREP
jgi:hypothetical protein